MYHRSSIFSLKIAPGGTLPSADYGVTQSICRVHFGETEAQRLRCCPHSLLVGDYREALRCSLKSLELIPGYGIYLDTLGRCYYAVGDLRNAVKSQKQAVEKTPYYQQIQRQLEFFEAELAKQQAQESRQPNESLDESNG